MKSKAGQRKSEVNTAKKILSSALRETLKVLNAHRNAVKKYLDAPEVLYDWGYDFVDETESAMATIRNCRIQIRKAR